MLLEKFSSTDSDTATGDRDCDAADEQMESAMEEAGENLGEPAKK